MEKRFVKLGTIFRSKSTLGTVPLSFRSFRYSDTFKMEPLVRAVVGVTANHLRDLVVGAAAVAVEPVGVLERRRCERRMRLGFLHSLVVVGEL